MGPVPTDEDLDDTQGGGFGTGSPFHMVPEHGPAGQKIGCEHDSPPLLGLRLTTRDGTPTPTPIPKNQKQKIAKNGPIPTSRGVPGTPRRRISRRSDPTRSRGPKPAKKNTN